MAGYNSSDVGSSVKNSQAIKNVTDTSNSITATSTKTYATTSTEEVDLTPQVSADLPSSNQKTTSTSSNFDANNDGVVNNADVGAMQEKIASGDDTYSIVDATNLQHYLNSKITVDSLGVTEDEVNVNNALFQKEDFYDDYMLFFADFDGDGKITDSDLNKFIEGVNAYKGQGLTESSFIYDLNGDGYISAEDARVLKRYMMGANNPLASGADNYPKEYINDIIDKMDSYSVDQNGDGKIDNDEIAKINSTYKDSATLNNFDLNDDGVFDSKDADLYSKHKSGENIAGLLGENIKYRYQYIENQRKIYPNDQLRERIDSIKGFYAVAEVPCEPVDPETGQSDSSYQGEMEQYAQDKQKLEDLDTLYNSIPSTYYRDKSDTNIFTDGKYDNLEMSDHDREMLNGYKATIEEYNRLIDDQQEVVDNAAVTASRNGIDVNIYYKQEKQKLESLKEERANAQSQEYQYKQAVKLREYTELLDTPDYREWADGKDRSSFPKAYVKSESHSQPDGTQSVPNVSYIGGSKKLCESYNYMSDEQLMIYKYLEETSGVEAADKYIDAIQDEINQAIGAELAADFLDDLDYTDSGRLEENLKNIFCTGKQGLGDGIGTFVDGLDKAFKNEDVLRPEDYKKMIILQTLQEKSNILDDVYGATSSIGNMLLPMAVSAIVSCCATPAAGKITGSVLMGVSAFGNAKVQARAAGHSTAASVLYATASGSMETLTEYFIGKIPFLGKTSGTNILIDILQEGGEEFLQEYLDAGFRSVLLGEHIDVGDLRDDAFHSFVMGMVVSGVLNGGGKAIVLTMNGVNFILDTQKVQTAIQDGTTITRENVSEYIAEDTISTDVKSIMNKEKVSYEIASLMYENGIDKETATVMFNAKVDMTKAQEIVANAKKFESGDLKIENEVSKMSDTEIQAYVSYYVASNNTARVTDFVRNISTEQMSTLLTSETLKHKEMKTLSNIISSTFDNQGGKSAFKADFKKIANDYIANNDVPQMQSFIDSLHADSWYGNTDNCPDGKIETWAMLQCLQAKKLSSKPQLNFLSSVNSAFSYNHLGADGKRDGMTFTNDVDAYFGVLNECKKARKKIADETWKMNNKAAYLADNPGATVMTQDEIDNLYKVDFAWLKNLTQDFAKKNGYKANSDTVTFFQPTDEYVVDYGSVGRQGNTSTNIDGGACCCDVKAVDDFIYSDLSQIFADLGDDPVDPKKVSDKFISDYADYASLKASEWTGKYAKGKYAGQDVVFHRVIATGVSDELNLTDGLNLNAFDMEWALGGETLAMNGEMVVEPGTVDTSSAEFSNRADTPITVTVKDKSGNKTGEYKIKYVDGLEGVIKEMYESDRVTPEQKTNLGNWYYQLTGTKLS